MKQNWKHLSVFLLLCAVFQQLQAADIAAPPADPGHGVIAPSSDSGDEVITPPADAGHESFAPPANGSHGVVAPSVDAGHNAFAPSNEESRKTFAPISEVGLFRGLMEFPVYSFYLGLPDVYGVAYVPNFSPRAGFQFQWKELGLTLSTALPIPKEEIERRGESDQFNFLFSRYWRQHGVDVYLQNYRGFYVASPLTEFRLNKDKPERNPQLPDAEITNYGLNYYQVLNPERYSLMAAFSQMELQLISGGSFLWTGFYNHLQMNRGQKFTKGTEPDSLQEPPNLKSGVFDTVGLGFGYGHTWVMSPVYFTVQGLAGTGVQHQKVDESNDEIGSITTVAIKINGNVAVGYSYKNYSLGGKILIDTLLSDIRGTQVYSTLLNGLLFFGSRF